MREQKTCALLLGGCQGEEGITKAPNDQSGVGEGTSYPSRASSAHQGMCPQEHMGAAKRVSKPVRTL